MKHLKKYNPMQDKITEQQYITALAETKRIEKYLQYLNCITRTYMYQWEAEKAQIRKNNLSQKNKSIWAVD